MRVELVVCSVALAFMLPERASSCEIISVRRGLASPHSARIVGTVTGYGEVPRPVAGVERAVSLRIKIDTVVPIPSDIPRTADGDLDFAEFDSSQHWQLGEFEFDRAVLALRSAARTERFRRLLNLAGYRGFHDWPDGRKWLDALISESRLSAPQGRAVLQAFESSNLVAR